MSNAKTTNIPAHLRGRIERDITKNNKPSLVDEVVRRQAAADNTAGRYLKRQRERLALERLPDFEREVRDEITMLREDNKRLNTLITVTNWLLLIAVVLGGVLCRTL